MMVAHHDTIIYERYAPGHTADRLHICWSATKTFTAATVGIAVQEGLIELNRPFIEYIPAEERPDSMSPELSRLTIEHLLKMSSGLPYSDFTDRIRAGEDVDVLAEVAAARFTHEPGTHWRYNNLDTYLIALALTHATGMSLEDYMADRLFRPLGITEWYFEQDSRGIHPGAWGLHLSTESLMRFGLFMLHRGEWQGQQILASEWFDNACTPQIYQTETPTESDWQSGYCYQAWACHVPGTYRVDGMWGQYVVVVPDKELVCVMTTLCTDRTTQMNAFWRYVYDKL